MARVVDFTGVGDFTPVPIADYTLTGTAYNWKNNADGQGEHCEFEYTIQDETAEDGVTPVQGRKVFTNYSPKTQALFRIKNDAVALGVDPELFAGQVDLDIVIPAMIGRSGISTLNIETYTRKDGTEGQRNTIVKMRPIEQVDAELAEAVGAGNGRARRG